MRTLSMDPGENTGWALGENGVLIDQGVIYNGRDGVIEWIQSGDCPRYHRLVLESFIVEPDFVGRAYPSEIIGIMGLHAAQCGAQEIHQSRSMKALLTRGTERERFAWLRNHGYHGVSHELDAITHLLLREKLNGNRAVIERHWPQ